jgi:hypothetical protein
VSAVPPASPAATPPAWLGRAVNGGTLFGAAVAGFMTFLPSHSVGEFFKTGLLILVVLGALRAFDLQLTPVWAALGRFPRLVRIAAGIAIPWWYSVSQFGPDAAGREVTTVRSTLVVTTILAYVLFHPTPSPDPQPGRPAAS